MVSILHPDVNEQLIMEYLDSTFESAQNGISTFNTPLIKPEIQMEVQIYLALDFLNYL